MSLLYVIEQGSVPVASQNCSWALEKSCCTYGTGMSESLHTAVHKVGPVEFGDSARAEFSAELALTGSIMLHGVCKIDQITTELIDLALKI